MIHLTRKAYICHDHIIDSAVAVFFFPYEETKKYARTENLWINISVLNNKQNLDQLTLYIVQHINRKLLSSQIQLFYPHDSQDIEGVLELVVNWIPCRRKIWWRKIWLKLNGKILYGLKHVNKKLMSKQIRLPHCHDNWNMGGALE